MNIDFSIIHGNRMPLNDGVSASGESQRAAAAANEPVRSGFGVSPDSLGLARADAIEEVPDSALQRDDALGSLIARAFDLPAPAMPNFD